MNSALLQHWCCFISHHGACSLPLVSNQITSTVAPLLWGFSKQGVKRHLQLPSVCQKPIRSLPMAHSSQQWRLYCWRFLQRPGLEDGFQLTLPARVRAEPLYLLCDAWLLGRQALMHANEQNKCFPLQVSCVSSGFPAAQPGRNHQSGTM